MEAGITTIEHGIFLTEEIVARMKARGTYLVATLNAPAAISAGGLAAGIPDFMVRKSDAVVPAHVASFQLALRAGVGIAAGSDAGTPLNRHGDFATELELMVKHGMSPLEAIRAATVGGGRGARPRGERPAAWPRASPPISIAVAGNPAERIEALADPRRARARPRRRLRA